MEQVSSIKISKDKLYQIIDIFVDTYSQFRFVSNIKSLLEISLLKVSSLCSEEDKVEVKVTQVKEVQPEEKIEIKKEETKAEVKKIVNNTSEKFNVPPFVEVGESYSLSEEDTINLMLQGDKIQKNKIIENWNKLEDYIPNEEIGKYANVLSKCSPRIVSQNILVLDTNFAHIANKVKIKANQKGFSELIQKICGKSYVVLALTYQESLDRVQKFQNLRQANKLPAPYPINIQL